MDIDGLGEILFVHGSPGSDEGAIRLNTSESEIRPMIENVSQDIIVCGHTHIQFDRIVDDKRSVGLYKVEQMELVGLYLAQMLI